MQKNLLFAGGLLLTMLSPAVSHAQKKTIVILGSSTTAAFGASEIDSGYASIVKRYYQNLQEINAYYIFGLPGATTYSIMPTNFDHGSRDAPDTAHNVTKALELNADIVLVNYPTNDILRYDMTSFLSNLRTVFKIVTDAGKICWITTTQPRNEPMDIQLKLVEARDSIYAEFGAFSIDFWDPIVDPTSLNINPIYNTGPLPVYNNDGTHPNNAGHRLLAQAVIDANILPPGVPLALSLTGFTAVLQRKGVLLSWTDMGEDDNTIFELQRSADGALFKTIGQEKGVVNGLSANHSWPDNDPLAGRNFYLLKMTEKEVVSYSKVAVINRPSGLAIDHIFGPSAGSRLIAGINVPSDQTINIRIISGAGVIHLQRSYTINAPLTEVPIDVIGLAAGTYVLQVIGRDGTLAVRTFAVF